MRALVFLVLAVALTACGGSATPRPRPTPLLGVVPAPSSSLSAHFANGPLSFRYPAGWRLERVRLATTFSSTLAYLANGKLGKPCVGTTTSITCGPPLAALAPNGIFVTWTADSYPAGSAVRIPGHPLLVDGHTAGLRVISQPGRECPAGAARVILVTIAGSAPRTSYTMGACIRGPNIRQREAQVMGILHSVRLTK